jgi:hypothetical protein
MWRYRRRGEGAAMPVVDADLRARAGQTAKAEAGRPPHSLCGGPDGQ